MVSINRNDFIEISKAKTKPTNWFEVIDKFLNNEKIQKSIFSIIEKFKNPTTPQQQQIINSNIKNDEEKIKEFVDRLCQMGRGKITLEELNKEFKKIK